MESRDIEWVLRWAFEQKGTEQTGNGLRSNWRIVERYGQLGARVDLSAPGTHSNSSGGMSAHADTGIISNAVDTLNSVVEIDWKLSAHQLLGDLWHLLSPDRANLTLPFFYPRHIVFKNARAGSRPSWRRMPRPRPEIGRNGKPILIGKRYASDRYSESAYCPLFWDNIEEVVRCRAEYAVWHYALGQLAVLLEGKLSDYVVLPPSAPATPWRMQILQSHASNGNA